MQEILNRHWAYHARQGHQLSRVPVRTHLTMLRVLLATPLVLLVTAILGPFVVLVISMELKRVELPDEPPVPPTFHPEWSEQKKAEVAAFLAGVLGSAANLAVACCGVSLIGGLLFGLGVFVVWPLATWGLFLVSLSFWVRSLRQTRQGVAETMHDVYIAQKIFQPDWQPTVGFVASGFIGSVVGDLIQRTEIGGDIIVDILSQRQLVGSDPSFRRQAIKLLIALVLPLIAMALGVCAIGLWGVFSS